MLILFHYWSLPILFLLHDFEEMIFCAAMEKEGKIHFPERNENRQLLWEELPTAPHSAQGCWKSLPYSS